MLDDFEMFEDAPLAEWPAEEPRLHPHALTDFYRRRFRGE